MPASLSDRTKNCILMSAFLRSASICMSESGMSRMKAPRRSPLPCRAQWVGPPDFRHRPGTVSGSWHIPSRSLSDFSHCRGIYCCTHDRSKSVIYPCIGRTSGVCPASLRTASSYASCFNPLPHLDSQMTPTWRT